MNIREFRQQHPEYNSRSDAELSQALHAKYYSSVPFETFAQQFGVTAEPTDMPAPQPPQPQPRAQTPAERVAAMREAGRMVREFRPREAPPGFVERTATDIAQNWPQYAGGTVGGIVGGIVGAPGGPAGMFAGSALGAGIGGAGGKGWDETLTGQINEDTMGKIALAGGEEATSEVVGRGFGAVISKLASGGVARTRMLPGIKKLNERLSAAAKRLPDSDKMSPALLKRARERGTFIPVSQGSQSRGIQRLENFVRGSYIGSGGLYDIKQINPVAFNQVVRETIGEFWDEAGQRLGPEQVGRLFRDAVLNKRGAATQAFSDQLTRGMNALPDAQVGEVVRGALQQHRQGWRAAGSGKYAEVDNIIKSKSKPVTVTQTVPSKILDTSGQPLMVTETARTWDIVDTSPIKALVPQILERAKIGGNLGSAPGLRSFAEELAKKPARTTFAQADALRSFILEESRKLKIPLGNKSDKIARAVADAVDAIDQSMEKAISGQGIDAMMALKGARDFWRVNSALDSSPFVQGLARRAADKPEQLAKYVFAPRTPKQISMAKAALGEDAFYQLRDTWLSQTVADSLQDPRSIGSALRSKLDKMGPDALKQMFEPDQLAQVYGVADAFAAKGAESFENELIAGAVDRAVKHPGAFIQNLFEPRNPDLARTVRRVVGDDQFKNLRAAWVEDLFRRAGPKPGQRFNDLLDNMGDDTLKAILTPKHLESLREVSRLGEVLDVSTIDASNIFAPLLEAGAITGLITAPSRALPSATVILGFPIVMGRVLSNEKWAYWLAEGVRKPDRMKMYIGRITTEMLRYGAGFGQKIVGQMPTRPAGRNDDTNAVTALSGFGGRGY